jgi:hypothetical protein
MFYVFKTILEINLPNKFFSFLFSKQFLKLGYPNRFLFYLIFFLKTVLKIWIAKEYLKTKNQNYIKQALNLRSLLFFPLLSIANLLCLFIHYFLLLYHLFVPILLFIIIIFNPLFGKCFFFNYYYLKFCTGGKIYYISFFASIVTFHKLFISSITFFHF